MPEEIYLDNNATTRPLPAVVEAMLEALGPGFGNPSSAHSAGDRSRALLERARESVAQLIGAAPEKVIFTSGGTEANNTVLGSVLGLPVETAPDRHLGRRAFIHLEDVRTPGDDRRRGGPSRSGFRGRGVAWRC